MLMMLALIGLMKSTDPGQAYPETDSSRMTLVSMWPIGTSLTGIVDGNIAYVGAGGGLMIYDITNPANPETLRVINTLGLVWDVFLHDTLLLIAAGEEGLYIVDNSDPANAHVIGRYDTPGDCRGVVAVGTRAYITDGIYGIRVINLSDPENPYCQATCETPGYAMRLTLINQTKLVLADGIGGVEIINISNPLEPMIDARDSTGAAVWRVTVKQGDSTTLYAANGNQGLLILNYDYYTKQFTERGRLSSNYLSYGIATRGNYAYLADGYGQLRVIDVSDPDNPVEVNTYSQPSEYAKAIDAFVNDTLLAVAFGNSMFRLADISTDPSAPNEIGFCFTGGYSWDIDYDNGYMYLADGAQGLLIFDVTVPESLSLVSYFDTPGYAYGVRVIDTIAFVADGPSGVRIVSVADPSNPYELGSYDTPGNAYRVWVQDNIAYVADGDSGITVLDISDYRTPSFIRQVPVADPPGGVYFDVLASPPYLYVTNYFSYILRYDISVPTTPVLNDYVNPGASDGGNNMSIWGDYLFVGQGGMGMVVLDVSDPDTMVLVGRGPGVSGNDASRIDSCYALLSDGWLGVRMFNIGNLTDPDTVLEYPEVAYYDGTVYSCAHDFWKTQEDTPKLYIAAAQNAGFTVFRFTGTPCENVGQDETWFQPSWELSCPWLCRGTVLPVSMRLASAGDVKLQVYDAAGRMVHFKHLGKMGPGSHQSLLNLGGLGTGVYFLVMKTQDKQASKRFMILR